MFRLTVLLVASTMISCYNVEARNNTDREPRSTNSESENDFNSLLVESFGNIGSIIKFIKSQIRDIVVDIFFEVVKFMRVVLHECKIKLFKRLGKSTLSDVFHFVFDGIFEFVGDSDTNIGTIDEASKEIEPLSEPSMYEQNYVFPDPYYLEKLIRAEKIK